MKFLVEKYKSISVWLSLAILALAFCIGSDTDCRNVCVPVAFLLGTVLYGLGGVWEWKQSRTVSCLVNFILALLTLTGAILSFLKAGGLM